MPDLLTLDLPHFLSLPRAAYSIGFTNRISIMIAFNSANVFYNGGYTVDYERVDSDMFTYFQSTHYSPHATYGHQPTPSTRPTHAGQGRATTTPMQERLTQFIRGTKRNKSDYPTFAKDSDYLHWSQRVRSTALTHGTIQVLNSTYVPDPNDQAEVDLFMHMNALMYSVLEECVKTDAGVEIVRSYQDIMDAQGAWAALGRRYLDSPAARLGVTRFTREIQDLRISNSHTGSIEAFITGFTQKVTDRDNMVPAYQRFSDSVKIEMLHDACYGHRDLLSVRTQIDCLQSTSGRILTYHEITQLYKVTAAPLDNEKFGSSSNRQSNLHDFHDNEGQSDYEDQRYDVNTSQSRTNKPFVKRAVRLPKKDTWHSLSPSDQKNWDTLLDQAKDLIIKSQATQASQARPRQTHHTETHDSSNVETDDNDTSDDKEDDVPSQQPVREQFATWKVI
jgi:hypothetical protein